jgi:hypothetical protein
MKSLTTSLLSPVHTATLALLGMLAVPSAVEAQLFSRMDYDERHSSRNYSRSDRYRSHGNRDYVTRRYHSHPSTSFTLSFGTGYAGRGYYYGPPNSSYYYQRPGVYFYRSWDRVPRSYRGYSYAPRNSTAIAVQQALGRLGYYHGRVDGHIGPASRRAIMNFEARNGLPVTGTINPRLMRALSL